MAGAQQSAILRVSCPDRVGVVAAIATFLARNNFFILESNQFGDPDTGLFFMRLHFSPTEGACTYADFAAEFAPLVEAFSLSWDLHEVAVPPRVVIMVSRHDHCLNDLLYRHRTGALNMDVRAVISNHPDARELVMHHGVPWYHVPNDAARKAKAEQVMLELIEGVNADLVILARYMQVLSNDMCERLTGRAINIHHSFLPSFKGAKPYHQAHQRGVKLIGATAHYVTRDLDEGPIIAQDVAAVDHSFTPDSMAALGRDIEARVLASAVKLHLEKRIFVDGPRTVIFR